MLAMAALVSRLRRLDPMASGRVDALAQGTTCVQRIEERPALFVPLFFPRSAV
jgi:hypothetical protein